MMPFARRRPRGLRADYAPLPFDMVSMPVAKAAIAEVIEPFVRGMEVVRPGMWATPLSDEHRALLSLQPYKGGVFELQYGISCRWIPHREGSRWRWHKTVRQSRHDLWVDHFMTDAPPCRHISHLHGLGHLRRQAGEALDAVAPLARRWWESVTEIPGVLAEARRQESDPGAASHHWPSPGLVTAFTLCHLGDLPAAERRLRAAGRLDEAELAGALERLAELAAMTS